MPVVIKDSLRNPSASRKGRSSQPEGARWQDLQTQSNRVSIDVERIFGYKIALTGGITHIVKP